MSRLPDRQPVLPLAVATVAVVVLILLATNAGLGIVTGIVRLTTAAVALVLMALVGLYLLRRGPTIGTHQRPLDQSEDRDSSTSRT